jgi:probable phosphoglycerate mutase
MKHIFLIRHGETAWTLSGQHTGKTDILLTEKGRRQSVSIAKKLADKHFSKVYCSPLQRAKETCEIVGLLGEAQLDPDLVEWDYGSYEGLTTEEIQKKDPSWTIFSNGAPGGESIAQMSERADRVLEKLSSTEGNIALFSSGHFLRSFTARWLGQPVSFGKHLMLFPASVSVLGRERNTPAILSWNNFS